MKKIISLLIILSMLLPVLPVFPVYAGSVNTYSAFLRMDNTLIFKWEADANTLLTIYGTDDVNSSQKNIVLKDLPADNGKYKYDLLKTGASYYNYYIFEYIKDGIINVKIVETEFILPRADKELKNVNHPYLMATPKDIDRVKALISENNPLYKANFDALLASAESSLALCPSESIASQSEAENICFCLPDISVAYVLTGDRKFLKSGLDCLLLLTDYMNKSTAFPETDRDCSAIEDAAIGYDLLYNSINEVDRQVIENGLFRKWTALLENISDEDLSRSHILPAIGLLLKDDTMVDNGLFNKNYGLFNIISENISGDGTMRNTSAEVFGKLADKWYRLAQMFYNCGYDMLDKKMSDGSQPVKGILNNIFYSAYTDGTYPRFDDESLAYGLQNLSTGSDIFEVAYARLKDKRAKLAVWQNRGKDSENALFDHYYQMFYAEPITDADNFNIGSGYFSKAGYNKLGNSVFADFGRAIFRGNGNAVNSLNSAFYWNNLNENSKNIKTLSLEFNYGGKSALYEPMSPKKDGSYPYGTVIYNTSIVDGKVRSLNEKDKIYAMFMPEKRLSLAGRSESIAIGTSATAIKACTDILNPDEAVGIEAKLERTVWQIDNYAIDVFRAIKENDAVLVTVLSPSEGENKVNAVKIPVSVIGNGAKWADAVKLTHNGISDIFMYGESYYDKKAGNFQSDAETAFNRDDNGETVSLGMINGNRISAKGIGLSFKTRASMQFAKLGDGVYRLDMAQGSQGNNSVRISGLGNGYKVFELTLSDNTVLAPLNTNGLSFDTKAEGIYIIAKDGVEKNILNNEKAISINREPVAE